jgi:signal transduction histidine kinase
MIKRIGVSVTAGVLLGLGTIGAWNSLHGTNEKQVARIAEAESYAARSRLVRNIDEMISVMHNVRAYWSAFGHLPIDEWPSDTGLEIDHLKGIVLIVWDDPVNEVRYVRTGDNPKFDRVPGDEEWRSYRRVLERAHDVSSNSMLGPFMSEAGTQTYEIILADPDRQRSSVLVAIVDIKVMLAAFLADESPGFAVRVESGDLVVYRQGEPAGNAPGSWVRSGLIRSSLGSIWRVVHQPTDEMVTSFESPAIDLILLLGLIIAVLMAILIFENGRARSRAVAAEIAEAQVNELNRDLEQQVLQRTEELAQRSSDLQMLTDSVGHDLRNPLNSLYVNVQLLEVGYGDQLGDDGKAVLRRLSPNVHQMSEVLDRLRGLSRVANSTFEIEAIDMSKLVREIFDDLQASEPGPPVRMDIRELPDVHADKTLVQILLVNLLSNALKYTRLCEPRVIIVGSISASGETVYFVKDNGAGFESDLADSVFTPFVQLDKGGHGGAGLGLTLERKVVLRHGGRIWAESAPGQGATFYFTLNAPAQA